MNTMTHKGYAARVEYSEEAGCFVGRIAGIRDVIGVHGESVAELRAAFEEAVVRSCSQAFAAKCCKARSAPGDLHFGDPGACC